MNSQSLLHRWLKGAGICVSALLFAAAAHAKNPEPEVCAVPGQVLNAAGQVVDRPHLGICIRGVSGKPERWLVSPEYTNIYESRDLWGRITGSRYVVSGSRLNGPYVLEEKRAKASQADYEKYGAVLSEVHVFNILPDGRYVLAETKKTAGTLFGAESADAQKPGTWLVRAKTPETTWGITAFDARESTWLQYSIQGLFYFNIWIDRLRYVAHKLGVFGGGLPIGKFLLPDPVLDFVDAQTLEPVGLPSFPSPTRYVHSGTRTAKPKGGTPYPESGWGPEKMDGMTVVRGRQPSGVLAWPASHPYIFMQGRNGLFGVIDRTGEWFIEPRFASAPDARMLRVPDPTEKNRYTEFDSGELTSRACYVLVCRITTNQLEWRRGMDKPELRELGHQWTLPLFSDPSPDTEWLRVTVAVAVVLIGLVMGLAPFTTLYHKFRYKLGWGGAIAKGLTSSASINLKVILFAITGVLFLAALMFPPLLATLVGTTGLPDKNE